MILVKGPFLEKFLFKNITDNKIKTFSRKSIIVPALINKIIYVHNGKNFLKVKINEKMVGYKLGEFSPTRKKFTFKKKK